MVKYDPDFCGSDDGSSDGAAGNGRWPNTYSKEGTPRLFGVNVTDGIVERIDILDEALRTREDIGLGSSVVDLLSTYPEVEAAEANTIADLYYLHDDSGTIVFEVATNLIDGYHPAEDVDTVIMMRVLSLGMDPTNSIAGTDFFAGRCLAP
jgi:hypothetical protein